MTAASAAARQEVYTWLFDSHSPHQQNLRIRILLEEEAFDKILAGLAAPGLSVRAAGAVRRHRDRQLGRPADALADLIGIIVNDGVRLPTVDLERLQFAVGTPYETDMVAAPKPQRVLAPEVAPTVRRAMSAVVARRHRETGARRLSAPRRQPVAGRRQDRHRRQPLRPFRRAAAG